MALKAGETVPAYSKVINIPVGLFDSPEQPAELVGKTASAVRIINGTGVVIYYGTTGVETDMVPLADGKERLIFIQDLSTLYLMAATGTPTLDIEVYS